MYCVKLLNSFFKIESKDENVFRYVEYFMDSYDSDGEMLEVENTINIVMHSGKVPASLPGSKPIKIHTTKHPYWNLSGEYVENENQRTVLWNTRGFLVTVFENALRIEITYDEFLKPVFVGESLFHVLRGIALYKRDNKDANFLHASGIIHNNKGILFTGAVSAGKTTLLLESIQKLGAKPLTNDRIFLKSKDEKMMGYSWPSYASFCEGTILQYPGLKKGALAYQYDEENKYRTIEFNNELQEAFDKGTKRVYPMLFLCDCFQTSFAVSSAINTIFISKLDINCKETKIRELSYCEDYEFIKNSFQSQTFDTREPSFNPWHGLELGCGTKPVERFITDLQQAGCKIFEANLSPLLMDDFIEYLKKNL